MSNPKVSKLTSILRTRSYEYQHLLGRLEPVVDRKKFWAQPQDLLPAASPLSIFQKLDDHLCMFFFCLARVVAVFAIYASFRSHEWKDIGSVKRPNKPDDHFCM